MWIQTTKAQKSAANFDLEKQSAPTRRLEPIKVAKWNYPACARFSLRRSRSDKPPQIPKRSSFSSAYSRHSTLTSHELQTRFASRVEPPFSGKNASGSVWAQSARSCHPRSSVSVKGSRAISLTWNLLVSRNKFVAALLQATNSCVTWSANRTSP